MIFLQHLGNSCISYQSITYYHQYHQQDKTQKQTTCQSIEEDINNQITTFYNYLIHLQPPDTILGSYPHVSYINAGKKTLLQPA